MPSNSDVTHMKCLSCGCQIHEPAKVCVCANCGTAPVAEDQPLSESACEGEKYGVDLLVQLGLFTLAGPYIGTAVIITISENISASDAGLLLGLACIVGSALAVIAFVLYFGMQELLRRGFRTKRISVVPALLMGGLAGYASADIFARLVFSPSDGSFLSVPSAITAALCAALAAQLRRTK